MACSNMKDWLVSRFHCQPKTEQTVPQFCRKPCFPRSGQSFSRNVFPEKAFRGSNAKFQHSLLRKHLSQDSSCCCSQNYPFPTMVTKKNQNYEDDVSSFFELKLHPDVPVSLANSSHVCKAFVDLILLTDKKSHAVILNFG